MRSTKTVHYKPKGAKFVPRIRGGFPWLALKKFRDMPPPKSGALKGCQTLAFDLAIQMNHDGDSILVKAVRYQNGRLKPPFVRTGNFILNIVCLTPGLAAKIGEAFLEAYDKGVFEWPGGINRDIPTLVEMLTKLSPRGSWNPVPVDIQVVGDSESPPKDEADSGQNEASGEISL